MSGERELVEKVARIIDGPGLTVDRAEAAIGVTLGAVREQVEESPGIEYQGVEFIPRHDILEDISGLSIESLGAEGGSPE